MASEFECSITLIDTNAQKTTLRFGGLFTGIDAGDEFDLAMTALAALVVSLEAVTDANVYKQTLTRVVGGSTALPEDADITDELAVIAFLTDDDVAPEYHTLRVPAPIDAVWESDGITLDKTNAGVIAYVAEFDQDDVGFQVSDHEYIETANANGIKRGFWRSKAKSTAKQTG